MGQLSKVSTRIGLRRQRCDAICNKGLGGWAPSAGSGSEPQSQTVFGKYLIEWSSFSSTFYHARKTAQDFDKVDDVVIQFWFQQFIFYRYLFSFIGLKYNSPVVSLLSPLKIYDSRLLESRGILKDFHWISICIALGMFWMNFAILFSQWGNLKLGYNFTV